MDTFHLAVAGGWIAFVNRLWFDAVMRWKALFAIMTLTWVSVCVAQVITQQDSHIGVDEKLFPGLQFNIVVNSLTLTNQTTNVVHCYLHNTSTNQLVLINPVFVGVTFEKNRTNSQGFTSLEAMSGTNLTPKLLLNANETYKCSLHYFIGKNPMDPRHWPSSIEQEKPIKLEGDYELYVPLFVFNDETNKLKILTSNKLKVQMVK
jgi:hypothetical protein